MRGLVVGWGSIGKRHLRNLRALLPRADLTLLRHRRPAARAEQVADATRVIYRIEQAYEDPPDFAVIASPAPYHLDAALPLATRGVHLFVEKPISHRLEGVDKLIDACQDRQTTLFVGYNLRFHPALQAVRQAVSAGKIGLVLGLQAEVGQYLPDWRPGTPYQETTTARAALGGGVLLELSHEFDLARWLVGEVTEVSCRARKVSDLAIDVEDWADVTLQFDDGAQGNIHLDMVQRSPIRRCRISGTEGTLSWDSTHGVVACYDTEARSWHEIYRPVDDARNDAYLAEMRHFLECVSGSARPLVDGTDGQRALEIALAAKHSARSGKTETLCAPVS